MWPDQVARVAHRRAPRRTDQRRPADEDQGGRRKRHGHRPPRPTLPARGQRAGSPHGEENRRAGETTQPEERRGEHPSIGPTGRPCPQRLTHGRPGGDEGQEQQADNQEKADNQPGLIPTLRNERQGHRGRRTLGDDPTLMPAVDGHWREIGTVQLRDPSAVDVLEEREHHWLLPRFEGHDPSVGCVLDELRTDEDSRRQGRHADASQAQACTTPGGRRQQANASTVVEKDWRRIAHGEGLGLEGLDRTTGPRD